jgi:hypothetical protein
VIQNPFDSARFLDVFCLGLGTAVAITLIFKAMQIRKCLWYWIHYLGQWRFGVVFWSMLNLAMANKNLHIVIYSIKMAFTSYKSSIATGLFRFKGTPLFLIFILWALFSNHFIIYLMVLFKHSFQTYKIWK